MISNPARFFISGNEERSFTYEGGSKLFHFSPYANKFSQTLENNLVFFANDHDHAIDVLKRMLEFALECKMEYLKNKIGVHADELKDEARRSCKNFSMYLEMIEAGRIKLTEAPMNQFMKVTWADNDSIH
jgi:hypothetical protein